MRKLTFIVLAAFLVITTGCNDDETSETAPEIATAEVSDITVKTAVAGGTITNAGTPAYTERGVCYDISANPTVDNAKVADNGTGTGSYQVNLTDLAANTTYYVRAYAINSNGTYYGNEVNFITLVEPELSSECDVLSFKDGEIEWAIDELTITAEYPEGTDLSNIAPAIEVSPGATVYPLSDEPQDFSDGNEVAYTVTAEDGVTEKVFIAKATVTNPPEDE